MAVKPITNKQVVSSTNTNRSKQVSTKGLKSEEYANNTESKLDKLRKLRRGN